MAGLAHTVAAQNVPLISGGVGFETNTSGGTNFMQPVIVPVLAAPVESHLLAEARGDLRELYTAQKTGGYTHQFFPSLQYLQMDIIANRHLTIVGGKYLMPFGTVNERLLPLWIWKLQETPLIVGVGTRSSGFGIGGEARGTFPAGSKAQLNYIGYFSANASVYQFGSSRAAGDQLAIVIPNAGLEIGTSYQRYLQQKHINNVGMHLWWIPPGNGFQLRSEYAHDPYAQGYWVETAYRMQHFGGVDSVVGRLEPVFRIQQTYRHAPNPVGQSDSLPGADTQQAEFGFVYHLPHEVRLNASYGRSFSTSNKNLWDISLVYRFLFPTWKGHK